MTVLDLREQRANIVANLRAHEDPSADNGWREVDRLGARIEAAERRAAFDAAFSSDAESDPRFAGEQRSSERYRKAYDGFIRGDQESTAELRALAAIGDSSGGYLAAPTKLAEQVIAATNTIGIRGVATKFTIPDAHSLGVPTVDADPADADWTAETTQFTEDSALSFGSRELHTSPLTKSLLATGKLIRVSPHADTVIASRLAYKFGVTQEKAHLTGDGVKKPLGIFTAASYGIPTSRDVSAGNTSTAITMDGLINALYSLRSQYLESPNLRWIFHRDAVKAIRLLRGLDGGANTGAYLWQPSTQIGQPDTLLGVPVMSSEYAPNVFTTGLYLGVVGDFTYYHIADALTFRIQRLTERFAETDRVGFLARLETDGAPVLPEAFARVKLA